MESSIAIIGIAASATMAGGAVWQLRREIATMSWHSTPGRILESQVVKHKSSDGPTYEAVVRYSYSVDGTEYTSNRISFYDHESGFRCDRQAIIERYVNQGRTVVYYNPENPEEALLKRGISAVPFAAGAISITVFAYILSQGL
jgi:hypothetical protein